MDWQSSIEMMFLSLRQAMGSSGSNFMRMTSQGLQILFHNKLSLVLIRVAVRKHMAGRDAEAGS